MLRNNHSHTPKTSLSVILVVSLLFVPATLAQGTYKTLYAFTGGADGIWPWGGPVFDRAGNLYGTTSWGGAYGWGAIFQLTQNADGSWEKKSLYDFCLIAKCADGSNPAGLIFDGVGNVYGTTGSGGAFGAGTVFMLTPHLDGSWTESVLYSFCSLTNCADGTVPNPGLTFDDKGNLYGMTEDGGAHGSGTVFEVTKNADGNWKESVLYHFCSLTNCTDGYQPFAGLIFDTAGSVYGTTYKGGSAGGGGGTVFKLTPHPDGSWTESVLHSFCALPGCTYGADPATSLIFDEEGNLYGTTYGGGNFSQCSSNGCGLVFQLVPQTSGRWKEKVIHRFTNSNGATPGSALTLDQAGNLYGTARFGGNFNNCYSTGCGVVFELVRNSKGGFDGKVLHYFLAHPGADPVSTLIFDASGNLYGTTSGFNSNKFGSVFEITR
jgi:uncharacterized repeat protein (TIGR03803 family)